MSDTTASSRIRLGVAVILGLAIIVFAVQLILVRPQLWPAGTGVALSGDSVLASLSEPRPVARIRPPNLTGVLGTPLIVTRVTPGSVAAHEGLVPGTAVNVVFTDRLSGNAGGSEVVDRFPTTPEEALLLWRSVYRVGPSAGIAIDDRDGSRRIVLDRRPVWRWDAETRTLWLGTHLGALLQMGALLLGALIVVALGSRGMTAMLMTLALVTTTIANGGSMFGAELTVPMIGEILLVFSSIITPLSFPIFGLAVLYFPSRAGSLDRHRWIYPALAAVASPMLVISLVTAAFLLGVDAAVPPLAWFATHSWIFDVSFVLALAANIAIVIEGIGRYRRNTDANERRRIQIVVYTGVPAVFAYAIKVGVPMLSTLAGRPTALPWLIAGVLQSIELLPAFGLPYAVAVKHVFSPRTVLRSGLQYALARRTLSVLVALPVAVLVVSLISERDRPLGEIVLQQPWFYALSLGLAGLGFRYRDQAQQWLDQRFFRAEYDAREILVSLANRVPYENDPTQLVALVMTQIDTALHPHSIAVLTGEDAQLDVVSSLGANVQPLRLDGGLATLLRWSDEPLEVFLDDERSPAARLPSADRAWLAASGVSLLVPILAGSEESRTLDGLIALGQKRSEEPFTPEDRRLLSGIAAQLSVAHDLSRLRKRASTGSKRQTATPMATPSMVAGTTATGSPSLAMCPACRRCFDLDKVRAVDNVPQCPDDGTVLQPVIGMVPVVDGKYRVDAVIGRGGMGAVFRARDLRLARDVAVKVVRADIMADPEAKARFEREAQIVARLQHPAIVTVFDYGNLPHGAAFLVMEFVAGEDLRHLLERERTLTRERTIELVAGIAEGVDAAHRAGVLHRDLKPENILLPANGTGPKVLDFGVAKMTNAASMETGVMQTHSATIIGTPAYMAPEQLRGDPLDGRADVYSLAVLTYEALTGRLPFGSGSFVDIGMKHADLSARVEFGGLATDLAQTLQQALSVNRDDRPATATALVAQLRLRPS